MEMDRMPGEREPAARAIDVLIWLADHASDTWGVRQVARLVGISPASCSRIKSALASSISSPQW